MDPRQAEVQRKVDRPVAAASCSDLPTVLTPRYTWYPWYLRYCHRCFISIWYFYCCWWPPWQLFWPSHRVNTSLYLIYIILSLIFCFNMISLLLLMAYLADVLTSPLLKEGLPVNTLLYLISIILPWMFCLNMIFALLLVAVVLTSPWC